MPEIELRKSLREVARTFLPGLFEDEEEEVPPPELPEHLKPKVPDEAYENMPVRPGSDLTIGQVAAIVTNENIDLSPTQHEPEELFQAKLAQAHAILNGDEDPPRPGTAPDVVSAKLYYSDQYKEALRAAVEAWHQQRKNEDPTDNHKSFGNAYSGEESENSRKLRGFKGREFYQSPYDIYGPFNRGREGDIYTVIYNEDDKPNRKKKQK